MRYNARELYAVINVSQGKPSRLYIEQDGKDLTAQNKGAGRAARLQRALLHRGA
jgi:hypothetical protein